MEKGLYGSAQEFIEQAVRMLHEQESVFASPDEISEQIEHGFAQAERGELIDRDDVISILRQRHRVA